MHSERGNLSQRVLALFCVRDWSEREQAQRTNEPCPGGSSSSAPTRTFTSARAATRVAVAIEHLHAFIQQLTLLTTAPLRCTCVGTAGASSDDYPVLGPETVAALRCATRVRDNNPGATVFHGSAVPGGPCSPSWPRMTPGGQTVLWTLT